MQTNAVPGSGFADFSDVINVPGSGETVAEYLDARGGTNGPARFYRIRLMPYDDRAALLRVRNGRGGLMPTLNVGCGTFASRLNVRGLVRVKAVVLEKPRSARGPFYATHDSS